MGRSYRCVVTVVRNGPLCGCVLVFSVAALSTARPDGTPATKPLVDAKQLVNGVIGRSEGVFSGRIRYRIKSGFADSGKLIQEGEYEFTFAGDSWAKRSATGAAQVSHRSKCVEYVPHLQKDGSYQTTASIRSQQSVDERLPSPPYFAGSFWHKRTMQFVKDHWGEARLLEGGVVVDGLNTERLEWTIQPDMISKAFYAVGAPERLRQPGFLRAYVVPQYGYALVRIEQVFGEDRAIRDAVYECSDFQEAGHGVFIPKKCNYQLFGSRGQPAYFVQYELTEIDKINEVIPEEAFLVTLPNGTSVTDSRVPKRSVSFRVGPMGAFPADLRDVLTPGEVSLHYGKRFWAIIIGTIVGLLLLLNYWLIRRWTAAKYEHV